MKSEHKILYIIGFLFLWVISFYVFIGQSISVVEYALYSLIPVTVSVIFYELVEINPIK